MRFWYFEGSLRKAASSSVSPVEVLLAASPSAPLALCSTRLVSPVTKRKNASRGTSSTSAQA
jgi:hypothetical protein